MMIKKYLGFVIVLFYAHGIIAQNNSLSFDGIDDEVIVVDSPSLNMESELTMEAWVKHIPDSDHRMVLNKEGEYEIALVNGEITYAIANTNPGWVYIYTGFVIPNNIWTHIAITYNSTIVIVYVDGISVFQQNSTGIIGDAHLLENEFRIGYRQRQGTTNTPFIGNIDEIRIWNIAKTESEINTNLLSELNGLESGLVAYYKFDIPNLSCDINDCTSFSNHGIRSGSGGSNNLPLFSSNVPSITDITCGATGNCITCPISTDFTEVINTDWYNVENWSGGCVPTIPITNSITINGNCDIDGVDTLLIKLGGSITINEGNTFTITQQ